MKRNLSDETRAKLRAAFLARRADPAFEKKRTEGVRRFANNRPPELREAMGEGVRRHRQKKRAEGRDKINYTPEAIAERAARLKAVLADPEIAAKRKANAARAQARRKADRDYARLLAGEGQPERKKCLPGWSLNDMKRGFQVPPAMKDDYRLLTATKKLPAAEAARVLGLIP